ncbi:MAG: PTS fructose transporter subunit EIIBC [Rhodospirillales bacterium 20-60-12]|nr:MAG: PTS fructose transporter subunit EIIBC [Rhodospirillales bacterium 20-60-12]HQT66172.1 fructose-specific PTS transporter subunit EIIC [Acetobacteraceae bacterium]
MKKMIASVTAGDVTVAGVLAAEALRKAAQASAQTIEIEIRTNEGILNPLGRQQIGDAQTLLLVGECDAHDPRFAGMAQIRASIAEILADAPAVLARMSQTDKPTVQRIVAITSCPTGIAHTFMAAEGLQQAALAMGIAMRVETQGSVGAADTLTAAEIAAADIVIIAADKQVDLTRFGGKRVFQSGTKPAINEANSLIARALADAQLQGAASQSGGSQPMRAAPLKAGPYKHLMSGVSFMIPFVTAGGLLIALAFALGGIYAYDPSHAGTLAYSLFQIGAKSAFVLFVPVLGGYIAYSIADRPGLAPGMIGGLVASNLGAGFLGAIVAGFIAGYGTAWLNRSIKLPRSLEGLKPVLILPLLGTLLTGLLMIYVVGTPVAEALAFLTDFLKGMQGSSAIVLGLLLGAMMAFDMGGPVNKAAYAFSVGLLSSHVYTPMAAVMAAGMTPPLALAIATRLFPARFTEAERESAGATGMLGLAFITEGAIPFAARDPFRVIPANMAGSAVAGAISMLAGAQLRVPHGGIFVLPIPGAVTHLGYYVAALAAGTIVSAGLLGVVKKSVEI